MERISKADLKQPDSFVRAVDRVAVAVKPHQNSILAGLVVLLLAGAGYGVWTWMKSSREGQAQSELFLITHSIDKRKSDLEEEFRKTHPGADPKKDEKKAAATLPSISERPKNLDTDLGPQTQQLQDFIKTHPTSQAAILAGVQLSNIYKEYGDVDKATQALESLNATPKANDILTSTVFLKLGDYAQIKGQCDKAIEHWDKVAGPKGLDAMKPEALLRKGLCFENLKQPDKAAETYEKLSKDYPESRAGREAKKFIRMLQTKS